MFLTPAPMRLFTSRQMRTTAALACALAVVAAGAVLVPGATQVPAHRWASPIGDITFDGSLADIPGLLAGVAGFVWVCAADARAAVISPTHRPRSVTWAVLGWLLPIVSLFYPPITLSRLGAASGLGRGWQWLLGLWFVTWFALPGAEGNDSAPMALGPSVSHVYREPGLLAVFLALKVLAWTAVVVTVTRAQERRLG